MASIVVFRPLRERTIVLRTRFLLDIYMREGDDHLKNQQYRAAMASFQAALELEPNNTCALVGVSRCHLSLEQPQHAMADVERALALDNVYPPAVLQKADILFALKNYEMALLFYHRGQRRNSDVKQFQEGVERCKIQIQTGTDRKLSTAGNLTTYVRKKIRQLNKEANTRTQTTRSSRSCSQRSSSTNTLIIKQSNPLTRLSKKQPNSFVVRSNKANRSPRYNEGRLSIVTSYSEPDEESLREILGHLYGDRVYLQGFVRQSDAESEFELTVSGIAESGLQFLMARVTYWNRRRLPPDPTPSPPLSRRRSRQGTKLTTESPLPRQKSSLWEREISDLIRFLADDPGDVTSHDDAIPGYRPYKREKKKVRKLHFEFATYRQGSDLSKREGSTTRRMTDIKEEEDDEVEDYFQSYLFKEIVDIQNAFEKGHFSECRDLAVTCLESVYMYSDEDIADKLDVIARVHSIVGNALLELEDPEEAQKHHERDLEIGEKCHLEECMSRALGNLGRVFLHQNHYHKALGAFARKAKLVERPVERAWLFHEIGDCFLSLNQFEYARDAGRKSLKEAVDAQNRMYQLQACVLIGVSQVKLRDYHNAYIEFETALDLAQVEGDRDSEAMITRALKEVNARMAEKAEKTSDSVQKKTPSKSQRHKSSNHETTEVHADDKSDGGNMEQDSPQTVDTEYNRMDPKEHKGTDEELDGKQCESGKDSRIEDVNTKQSFREWGGDDKENNQKEYDAREARHQVNSEDQSKSDLRARDSTDRFDRHSKSSDEDSDIYNSDGDRDNKPSDEDSEFDKSDGDRVRKRSDEDSEVERSDGNRDNKRSDEDNDVYNSDGDRDNKPSDEDSEFDRSDGDRVRKRSDEDSELDKSDCDRDTKCSNEDSDVYNSKDDRDSKRSAEDSHVDPQIGGEIGKLDSGDHSSSEHSDSSGYGKQERLHLSDVH